MTTKASRRLEIEGDSPLYKQVEREILQRLADGEWKPGEQLPTEAELASRLGVALFTVRAGVGELVKANILVRKQGKGTFVARHNRQRQRYQFSHVFDASGTQIFPERELVSFSREPATDFVAHLLQLESTSRPTLLRIELLLTIADNPAGLMEIALPARRFPDLTAKAIREGRENLYAVYQDLCGINVIRVSERVFADAAKPAVARVLRMSSHDPVLRIERVAYTYNDLPVEYRIRYFNATRYHYRAEEGGV